jgi:hypothetical protein
MFGSVDGQLRGAQLHRLYDLNAFRFPVTAFLPHGGC